MLFDIMHADWLMADLLQEHVPPEQIDSEYSYILLATCIYVI